MYQCRNEVPQSTSVAKSARALAEVPTQQVVDEQQRARKP
jgi:hypothetical protein